MAKKDWRTDDFFCDGEWLSDWDDEIKPRSNKDTYYCLRRYGVGNKEALIEDMKYAEGFNVKFLEARIVDDFGEMVDDYFPAETIEELDELFNDLEESDEEDYYIEASWECK